MGEPLDTSPIGHGIAMPGRERRERRWWDSRSVLSATYLGVVALLCATLLYSLSVPGMVFMPFIVVFWPLAICGLIWFALALTWFFGKHEQRRRRVGITLLAAAAIVMVTAMLLALSVPLRVRFELGRGDFDAVAQHFEQHGEPFEVTVSPPGSGLASERLGTSEIFLATVRDGSLVLFERNGAFFDNAGFVYAPDGRLPSSAGDFESPSYTALGGGWYAFTASW